jgi:hypothetical protein
LPPRRKHQEKEKGRGEIALAAARD